MRRAIRENNDMPRRPLYLFAVALARATNRIRTGPTLRILTLAAGLAALAATTGPAAAAPAAPEALPAPSAAISKSLRCLGAEAECREPETQRPDGSVLRHGEHAVFQRAIRGEMRHALYPSNGGGGFYPIEFSPDVVLLMDRYGEGVLVNARGLGDFLAGRPIAEGDILDAYAPPMTLGEFLTAVAANLPLVLAPGGALTVETLVRAYLLLAGSGALGEALDRAGFTIPDELNPFHHLDALFAPADATGGKAADTGTHALLREARATTTGANLVYGPHTHGSETNTLPGKNFVSAKVGTQRTQGDSSFNAQAGLATQAARTAAYGETVSRRANAGFVEFGVANSNASGLAGAHASLGYAGLDGAGARATEQEKSDFKRSSYLEASGSVDYRIPETPATASPMLGVGVKTIGSKSELEGVFGASVSMPIKTLENDLIKNTNLNVGYRHSYDSKGMVNIGGDIGGIGVSINAVNPSLAITTFKFLAKDFRNKMGQGRIKFTRIELNSAASTLRSAKGAGSTTRRSKSGLRDSVDT